MKKIPETFKANGYDYRLLQREGAIAIYEQISEGVVYGYEVHKVRITKACIAKYRNPDGTYNIVERPEMEALATNTLFGKYGWSYNTLKEAIIKSEQLRNKIIIPCQK